MIIYSCYKFIIEIYLCVILYCRIYLKCFRNFVNMINFGFIYISSLFYNINN